MVDDLKEYPISSNKRNLQEYFSGHVPNGLKQGDVYEDGEHLKKALIKKKHAVAITSKLSMRDDIYIQSGKVVPLQIEEKLRRRIIIASLVSQREQWIHTEGIIYQALCDCVRDYFLRNPLDSLTVDGVISKKETGGIKPSRFFFYMKRFR